ncbi:MAG: hypothetical protein QXE90_00985 [Candidatus Micrarchaeia archaeon]
MLSLYTILPSLFKKIKPYVILLFLFFSLLSISYAQISDSEGERLLGIAIPNWLPVLGIVALIGFLLAGIGFMLGKAFSLPKLETWAKSELYEVSASLFLVLILLIAVGVIDNIYVAVTGYTPMHASTNFLDSIANELMDAYLDTIRLGYALGLLSGPPPQYNLVTKIAGDNKGGDTEQPGTKFRLMVIGLDMFTMKIGNPFAGVDVFNSHMGMIQSVSLFALIVSLFSNAILNFVWKIALPVLIPFGLFLNFFTITRKMGRTLIAFGIGLYIFVPLSIIIFQTMYNSAFQPNTAIPHINKPGKVDVFVNTIKWYAIVDFLGHLAIGVISGILNVGTQGPFSYIPFCITSGVSYSSICGIFAPVCAPIFILICDVIKALFNEPASIDLMEKVEAGFNAIRITWISTITGTNVAPYIGTISLPSIVAIPGLLEQAIEVVSSPPVTPAFATLISNYVSAIAQSISNIALLGAYVALNKDLAPYIVDMMLNYLPYILQYVVPFIFLPFIILIVVVTGIRSISPAIGGEVQILGVAELV